MLGKLVITFLYSYFNVSFFEDLDVIKAVVPEKEKNEDSDEEEIILLAQGTQAGTLTMKKATGWMLMPLN